MSSTIDTLAATQQIPPPTQAPSSRRSSPNESGNAAQATSTASVAGSASVREMAEAQASGRPEEADAAGGNGAAKNETAKSENLAQPDILEAAVEAFNSRIDLSNRSTRFRISEETGQIQIQIVDKRTDEVIRSIPNDESLKIAARFKELAGSAVGALVDTSS